MKKIIAATAIAGTLALTGCGSDGGTRSDNEVSEITVSLDDGRRLPCIQIGHGLSCDWGNAR